MLDFPASPTLNQVFEGWFWDGAKWSAGSGSQFWTNVKAAPFNAVGNGIADDTAAIQAAATSIPSTGGVLLLPPAVYGITATIFLKSNTKVIAYGATLLAIPPGFTSDGPLMTNVNNAARVLTDHDIGVNGLTLDYGVSATGGGSHAVEMVFVSNVRVIGCTMQCRNTAGNATAMIGCFNTVVEDCFSFGHVNCAYDHWWAPQQARLTNCYAETASAAQMVNFNPEPTSGPDTGFAAVGFVMEGCELRNTGGGAAIPIQIEPLGGDTIVSDVEIHNNIIFNCRLAIRRAINNCDVSHNTFDSVLGGGEVIASYAADGGSPTNLTIIGNKAINPVTSSGNIGVIRIETSSAVIIGNTVTGSGYTAASIDTSTFSPLVLLNSVSQPANTPFATYLPPGVFVVPDGASFGSVLASSPTDLSKHIALWGTAFGLSITANRLNIVTNSGGAIGFYSGSTFLGYMDPSGINMPIGQGAASPGTFNPVTLFPGGCTITSVLGVPSSTQPLGSLCMRADGGVGSTLYVSRGGGTWDAVAGV